MLHLRSSWLQIRSLRPKPNLSFFIARNARLKFPIR